MKMSFVDLKAQYKSIKDEIDAAIAAVIRDAAFVGGPYVDAFERSFAEYCGVDHALGLSNGTDAIRLALLGCGVGPGDEVITVPSTFIATTEAVAMVGAEVRFVDVDPETGNLDPTQLASALTRRTRAIVPVHLYGQPAEMDPILGFAREHGLKVVADAAQAHGATYRDRPIATLGDAVCFSFYPGKNLGAYGDAGAVVTTDGDVAERIRVLRDHGRLSKYEHSVEGFNCRLDGLQAAILSVKLRHLDDWIERRRRHAAHYTALLVGTPGVAVPVEAPHLKSVYHLYVVKVQERRVVQDALASQGISTGIHYPMPLHLQPAYAHLKLREGSFPIAERHARTVLSLPMYPELTEADVERVADVLRRAVQGQ